MLHLTSKDLTKLKIEALIVPVCEDHEIHAGKVLITLSNQVKKLKEFNGAKADEITLYQPLTVNAERVIFLGLGKREDITSDALRRLAGKAVKKCIKKGLKEIMFAVPSAGKIKLDMPALLETLFEGAYLGNHLFDKYIKEKKKKSLKQISLNTTPGVARRYRHLQDRVKAVCDGTILARDWVSMPPNDKTPKLFTQSIAAKARKKNLKVVVLDENELKKMKFGAMLAVAAGSEARPRMILLEYNPRGAKKTIAFIGKGVTFDSGGINLKPSGSLEDMKMDMAGGAAVAGAMIAIAGIKPDVKVVGAIPVVENMPSGSATRPGDIIKSFSGKTIEIGNTDAEGRLILADALSYVIKKYHPETIIDLATLTGACILALGEKIAGVFSFDDDLAADIICSGEHTHERCWRLPLPDDYRELNKSRFADIKNLPSSRYGGAITAALFLADFVGDTRWAHLDIAGPAYAKKEDAYISAGGTGFGVRLLCDFLKFSSSNSRY